MTALATGCQTASKVTNRRLIEHQALIDFSGLAPAETVDGVKVSCSVPRQWEAVPLKKAPLYSHQQWKSPSTHTGLGVVYISHRLKEVGQIADRVTVLRDGRNAGELSRSEIRHEATERLLELWPGRVSGESAEARRHGELEIMGNRGAHEAVRRSSAVAIRASTVVRSRPTRVTSASLPSSSRARRAAVQRCRASETSS